MGQLTRQICNVAAALAVLFSGQAQTLGQTARHGATPMAAVSTSRPQRWIVVYRDRQMPEDAAERLTALGGRIVRRHALFGMAVAELLPAQAVRLRSAKEVEFAFPDRLVSGMRLPAVRPTTQLATDQQRVQARSVTAIRLSPSIPQGAVGVLAAGAPAALGDRFYRDTPQQWAVKAAGGFGGGVDGGPAAGPWAEATGRGVRIAILDSGIDRTHPDLAGKLVLNLSEVDPVALPSPCEDGSPQDQQGHGTWAASLAAAAAGPQSGDTVGVAPDALLMNIKVLQRMPAAGNAADVQCAQGQASGLLSWVLQGMEDAIAQHADVISLSLGTLVDISTADGAALKASFDRVTHMAALSGAVVVAAAGNEGFDLSGGQWVELPAQASDVLAVAATTNPECREDLTAGAVCQPGPVTLPYYSNRGSDLHAIAAPGGSYPEGSQDGTTGWIRGACSSGLPGTQDGMPSSGKSYGCFNLGHTAYVQAIGTSASAPLVAGLAALLRSAHPGWSTTDIVDALRTTADTVDGVPYGVVNATAAMHYKP